MVALSELPRSRSASTSGPVSGPGPLELQLLSYKLLPSEEEPWYIRLHQSVLANRVTMTCAIISFALEILEIILTGSVLKAQNHATVLIGLYSCGCVQFLVYTNKPRLRRWFDVLTAAVAQVERHADVATAEAMGRTARRGVLLRRVYFSYGVCVEIFVGFSMVTDTSRWAAPYGDSVVVQVVRWLLVIPQLIGSSTCLNCFHYLMPMLTTMYGATCDLYDATARHLEEAPCEPWCAAVQSSVLRACLIGDGILVPFVPHLIFGVAMVPLVATVGVLVGESMYDPLTLAVLPILVMLFVPPYVVGERQQESRRALGHSAYRGPWLDETTQQRRLRCNMMTASMGVGASLRGSGVGTLDHPGCFAAMKSWFGFVQLVINFYDPSKKMAKKGGPNGAARG